MAITEDDSSLTRMVCFSPLTPQGERMATKKERDKRANKVASAKEWASKKQDSDSKNAAISLPGDVSAYSLKKAGTHRIDILPYRVKVTCDDAEAGSLFFTKKYFAHKNIGPEEKSYACLLKNWGKPCPVCEHVNKLKRQGADQGTIQALKAKQRQLWNVVDLAEQDKGVQVWETGFYLSFGVMLRDKILAADEEDGYQNFADLEDGMTVKVLSKDAKFRGIPYQEVANIEMVPRKEAYGEEMLDQVTCLDDLLVELPYKELKRILLQTGAGGEDEDETEEAPARNGKAHMGKPSPQDEDEDEEESEDEDFEEEEDLDEEEDEEEEPAPKARGKGKKPAKDEEEEEVEEEEEEPDEDEDEPEEEDEDDDWGEDEEEEEPAPKKGRKPAAKSPPPKKGRR